MIVGAIEEILMDPSFSNLQDNFCNKHCDKFDDTEESKIIYTTLFQEYTRIIETALNDKLKARIEVFL